MQAERVDRFYQLSLHSGRKRQPVSLIKTLRHAIHQKRKTNKFMLFMLFQFGAGSYLYLLEALRDAHLRATQQRM